MAGLGFALGRALGIKRGEEERENKRLQKELFETSSTAFDRELAADLDSGTEEETRDGLPRNFIARERLKRLADELKKEGFDPLGIIPGGGIVRGGKGILNVGGKLFKEGDDAISLLQKMVRTQKEIGFKIPQKIAREDISRAVAEGRANISQKPTGAADVGKRALASSRTAEDSVSKFLRKLSTLDTSTPKNTQDAIRLLKGAVSERKLSLSREKNLRKFADTVSRGRLEKAKKLVQRFPKDEEAARRLADVNLEIKGALSDAINRGETARVSKNAAKNLIRFIRNETGRKPRSQR